jgi:hypothetical protein
MLSVELVRDQTVDDLVFVVFFEFYVLDDHQGVPNLLHGVDVGLLQLLVL